MQIGIGYDIHRLVNERKLVLGGVEIKHTKGLLGHSDADVLLHAIGDAILGSISAGDIGTHFPNTDPKYEGISSLKLLEKIADILGKSGNHIVNIDSVIIAEEPKLVPYMAVMRQNISNVLGILSENVSIKATTNEQVGSIGSGEAIAAYAIVLVESIHRDI